MNKAYGRINWENYPSTDTPLNETNLNKIDLALDTIDDRVVLFDTTKANQSALLECVNNISYNTSTGVFVFTYANGTSLTVDLNIEKIPVSFTLSSDGILTMTTADGTTYTADIADIIPLYTFDDTSKIAFTTTTDESGDKVVTADIIAGSIEETDLETNFLANCRDAQDSAEDAEESAIANALKSEGYAVGKQNGTDVESASDYYHNNSKYYSDLAGTYADNASTSASASATSASSASTSASSASTSANNANTYQGLAKTYRDSAETFKNNASTFADNASASATSANTSAQSATNSASTASTSATNASASATLAESYCKGGTGTRQGEDTDNCLYYKGVCESLAGGGLVPSGTIEFTELAQQTKVVGHMFTITDDFVSTSDFEDGGGIAYPAWTNVYCTVNSKWDCIQGASVVGVKGNSETDYRRGNVNITKANIGLGNVDNTADANKNVASALKATQDASGNVITSTYATKTELGDGTVTKVGTSTVGSALQGIYLNSGVPTACTYKLEVVASLPSNPDPNTFYIVT